MGFFFQKLVDGLQITSSEDEERNSILSASIFSTLVVEGGSLDPVPESAKISEVYIELYHVQRTEERSRAILVFLQQFKQENLTGKYFQKLLTL